MFTGGRKQILTKLCNNINIIRPPVIIPVTKMSANKNEKVMIACVTDEVTMVTQPLTYYNIERVHIISFVKPVKDKSNKPMMYRTKFYEDVRDTVLKKIKDMKIEIVSHTEMRTYNFEEMMQTVYSIITEEQDKGSMVYVNLSSGTKEFSAAAAIASMMHRNVNIFTVGGMADALTMTRYDEMMKSITHDNEIVGRFYKYHDPYEVTSFSLTPPPMRLLRALKVFSDIEMNRRSNTAVIEELIDQGLWKAPGEGQDRYKGTSVAKKRAANGKRITDPEYKMLQRKEAVQYQRNFIDKWKELGWIYKDPDTTGTKYDLTSDGRMNLKVFCPDQESADE